MTGCICRVANFLVPDRVYWDETRADLSDVAFVAAKSRTGHLTAKSEPWTSAGPRLGASIGLATRLPPQNLILRENRKIVREPCPTVG